MLTSKPKPSGCATRGSSRPGSADKRITGRAGVEQRNRIRRRDNGLCVLCGRLGHEVDHIKRLDDGGTNEDGNLRLLCRECHLTVTYSSKGCDEQGNPNGGWAA